MPSKHVPTVHPRFAAHFTDQLYSDAGNDLAPFGSDEGADILAEFIPRRAELGPTSRVRDLLAEAADDVDAFMADTEPDQPDLDAIIIGTGFTLLRLTGHIDREGLRWTMSALERNYRRYQNPEARQMLTDLTTYPDASPATTH